MIMKTRHQHIIPLWEFDAASSLASCQFTQRTTLKFAPVVQPFPCLTQYGRMTASQIRSGDIEIKPSIRTNSIVGVD